MVIIGGGPGWLRHGPVRRRGRAVGGHGRDGQGGRYLPPPRLRAGQGVPRDGGRLPHRRRVGQFGIDAGRDASGGPTLDFSVSQARKQQVVDQLFKGLAGLLKGRGITVFSGSGTLLPGHRVRIAGNDGTTTEITGTDVVLAAGSVPRTIPGFDIDGALVMTSDEVLALEKLPDSVAVVGGWRHRMRVRLDAQSTWARTVTVFEALPTILSGCDDDVVKAVARSFRKRGIEVKAGVQLQGHTPDPSGRGTTLTYGDGEKLEVDAVVVSVGRRPRTEGLLGRGDGRGHRRPRLRGGRRDHAHRLPRGSGPWAMSWRAPPNWPTSDSPRGSS